MAEAKAGNSLCSSLQPTNVRMITQPKSASLSHQKCIQKQNLHIATTVKIWVSWNDMTPQFVIWYENLFFLQPCRGMILG